MPQIETIQSFIKKSLGLAIVISAATIANAQEKIGISGKIVSTQNQEVPYASVTFSNKANKLYSDATLTDEKGVYKIELTPGNYDVTIEAIDFRKLSFNKQISKAGSLGSFKLEPESSVTNTRTKDIEGVTLTATVKPYKVELDKKTYDVNQDLISKGGSLQDVLQNVPSVAVDTDGTVSMRGSSNIKFLINGKPSALLGIDDGANALQTIPADQIDKIEVITNPSSKFEASGTAGILNIILKKTKKTGFNGSVTGTLGYLPQTGLNTNLSWRSGKLTLFLNGGGSYRESNNTNKYDNYYQNPLNSLLESHQKTLINNNSNNYNASTGLVYDISKKTSANISGTIRSFDGENNGNVDYKYLYINNLNTFANRLNDGMNNNLAFQADMGLDHKFNDKGQNLSLSLSLQKNKSNSNTNITETESNNFVLQDLISQNTKNNSAIGKADYELPIGEKSKLEAGYRLDINNNYYNNNVQESTASNPNLAFLKDYTFDATYKEMFNAIYAQYKSKIGNLGYQIGLRNEFSNINIIYKNLNTAQTPIDKTKSYNNIFPSIYLSYNLTKENQLLLNYSKRIDRPRSFFMIPNPSYSDNQNIFDGNVDLNPSYVDTFELGYSISKKKFMINPTLYFRHQTDDTKMLVYNEKDANDPNRVVFHTKPINLGTDDRFGLDLNFNWDTASWLKFLGSVDLFGYNTKGSILYNTLDKSGNPIQDVANFDGNGLSSRIRLTSTFKIDKTFNVQLQGYYRGGQKTAYQIRKNMYSLSLGASKTIWKGNGTISFNIQDIFNTRAMQSTTFTANSTRNSYMQFSPRQFALSFTYRFKQGEKVEQPKKKRDINNNDNGGDDQVPPM